MGHVYLRIHTVCKSSDIKRAEIYYLNHAEAAIHSMKEGVELYRIPYEDWPKMVKSKVAIQIVHPGNYELDYNDAYDGWEESLWSPEERKKQHELEDTNDD
jgi:hypothetical protein